jgi:hypothetical protein
MMTNPHIPHLDDHSNSTSMSNRGRGDNSNSSNSIRVGRERQDDDTNDGRDYDHSNGRDYDHSNGRDYDTSISNVINMDGVFDQDIESNDDNGKLYFLFKMIFTLLHFDLHLFFNRTTTISISRM